MKFFDNAQDWIWRKIPNKYKTIVSFIFIVAILIILWMYVDRNENTSDTQNTPTTIVAPGSNVAIGNSAPVTQNLTVNQIPKPEIHLEETQSATKIINLGLFTAGLIGQYETTYKLSVRSVVPIPRILLYTDNKENVVWFVQQDVGFNIRPTNMTVPAQGYLLKNANGDYVISVATTSSNSINIKYSVN